MRFLLDDTDDDQTDLLLDAIARRDLQGGMRAPGIKPMGDAGWWCQQAIVIDDARIVTCYGSLRYRVDMMTGNTVSECTRPGCGHVAVVPRRRPKPEPPKPCRCGRVIAGENEGKNLRGPSFCLHCRREKNAKARERERAKRSAA